MMERKGGVNRFSGRVTQRAKQMLEQQEWAKGQARHLESWMGKGSWDWRKWELLAHIDPLCDTTLLAQHVAAPVKSAIAAFAACLFQYIVSTAAAQRAAAVCAVAGFVADASLRTRRVDRHVTLTKVRRLLKVHQLSRHASTTTSVESSCAPTGAVSSSGVENPIVLVLGVDKDG